MSQVNPTERQGQHDARRNKNGALKSPIDLMINDGIIEMARITA